VVPDGMMRQIKVQRTFGPSASAKETHL